MKLIRLKITDHSGFRSLQPNFEYAFRSDWQRQDEQGFSPFVCAGRNGSGKSNLLEALAAIFFNIETRYLEFIPTKVEEQIDEDEEENVADLSEEKEKSNNTLLSSHSASPNAYELEYLIPVKESGSPRQSLLAHVLLKKEVGKSPEVIWLNYEDFGLNEKEVANRENVMRILPEYVLGYSSGENEVLSLPFFKMRFVHFDEYMSSLKKKILYYGRPESRLTYLDSEFSQAIMLCNWLFEDSVNLQPFREDIGLDELKQFRIIIKRSFYIDIDQVDEFIDEEGIKLDNFNEISSFNPALQYVENEEAGTGEFKVNLMHYLEADSESSDNFDPIVTRLKRCATCYFLDETEDTLYLDFKVNEVTRRAFKENFDNAIELFQAFQVLLSLNLYQVSSTLKNELYQSGSLYVSETVPVLASDARIMRFKDFWVTKKDVEKPVLLKSLSDGEHQLLHSLGLCLLFKDTNSLFLLDEPETHFNPNWRSNFISRLRDCFPEKDLNQACHEMLITTHTPFLISDSLPEKVLVFDKKDGEVTIDHPKYNTLGASINNITMKTFGKRETIGGYAQSIMDALQARFEAGEDKENIISEINTQLGASVEKVLLIKTILDSMEVDS
jgi:restriction system-associated AAA family ATPase